MAQHYSTFRRFFVEIAEDWVLCRLRQSRHRQDRALSELRRYSTFAPDNLMMRVMRSLSLFISAVI